jgi:Flp pilus assembly protein TadD
MMIEEARTMLKYLTIALLFSTAAYAADPRWETCRHGTGKQAVAACTSIIDDGTSEDLWLAYLDRGATYYNMEQYGKAEIDVTRSIELEPNNPRAWKTRGKARAQQKDYAGARADLRKALGLELMDDPDFAKQKFDAQKWLVIVEQLIENTKRK